MPIWTPSKRSRKRVKTGHRKATEYYLTLQAVLAAGVPFIQTVEQQELLDKIIEDRTTKDVKGDPILQVW